MVSHTAGRTTKNEVDSAHKSNLYDINEVVLPWENKDDFIKHTKACREAFNPLSQLQEEEVFEIGRLYWVKRRNNVGYHKAYFEKLPSSQLKEAEQKGPEAVRAFVENQAALQIRARDQIWAFVKDNTEARSKVAALLTKATTEGEGPEPLNSAQVQELKQTLNWYNEQNEALAPLLKQIGQANPEQEMQIRFDLMERNAKLNAEIDRQIDKRIARLVNLKEYDRMYGKSRTDGACIDVSPKKISKKDQ